MSTYSDLILSDSPVAYWRLGESSGTTSTDEVAALSVSWSGSPSLGATGLIAGDSDTAIALNGSTQYAQTSVAAVVGGLINGAPAITVEAWVKPSQIGSAMAILGAWINASNQAGLYFEVSAAGNIGLGGRSQNGDSYQYSAGSETLVAGNTHHVCGILDFANDSISIYVDGVLDVTASKVFGATSYAQGASTKTDKIGTNADANGAFFAGTIDELAIYDRALTAQEIAGHHVTGASSRYADLSISEAPDILALVALQTELATIAITEASDTLAISALSTIATIAIGERSDAFSVDADLVFSAQISAIEAGDIGSISVFADWRDVADREARIIYRMILSADGFDDLMLPISSWQSTVQSGAKSYLQAVIPAAVDHYADVIDRQSGTMKVYRAAVFPGGEEQRQLMAASPLQTIRYDRGATNASITISGYWTESEASTAEITLKDVRTLSVTSGIRARASIDWGIRPGHIAHAAGQVIDPVRYINFYVSVSDEYMDVGN